VLQILFRLYMRHLGMWGKGAFRVCLVS